MFCYTGAMEVLHTLGERYPFLHTTTIATTKYNRQVTAIRIGCGRRRVILTAAHHANEWITALVLLAFLEDYACAFTAGQRLFGHPARQLYRQTTLYLVPLVNPDGVDLVTGAVCLADEQYRQAKMIADRYPRVPFPDGWKANADGVDLNLNYPAGFEKAVQIKKALGFSAPAPCNWPGQDPLDQPESAALAALTEQVRPHAIVALHTQGREIYWSYGNYQAHDARELGQRMACVSGYQLAEPDPNSANAGYKDWFEDRFSRPGYTIEAGLGENPLPLSQLGEIYSQVMPILVLAITG